MGPASRSFRRIFRGLAALALAGSVAARADDWDVGVVFLGRGMAAEEQAAIDRNLLELAFSDPNDRYRISVLRELPDRRVSYHADPKSTRLAAWDPLFSKAPYAGLKVAGELATRRLSAAAEEDPLTSGAFLKDFFRKAFARAAARRVLVVYGHGEAYAGMDRVSVSAWRAAFEAAAPRRTTAKKPFDILWLDACFMANFETLFEFRGTADWLVASEEAEFTEASPFEALEVLAEGPSDAKAVETELADKFLASYSFERQGRQRHARERSAATISVVDPGRLEALASPLEKLWAEIKGGGADALERKLGRRRASLAMEKADLLDLGGLAEALESKGSAAARTLVSTLELRQSRRERVVPRVRARAPVENARLVYGYDDWRAGHQADTVNLARLPKELAPERFVAGPKGREWPSRTVRRRLYLHPFTVSQGIFNFYWLDPNGARLGEESRARLETDVFAVRARRAENPVVFAGFTQGIGRQAERYTGLSILDPLAGLTSFDYPELEAVKRTKWGEW